VKQLLLFILILLLPVLYLSGCSKDYNKESLLKKKLFTDNIDKIEFNKCTGKQKIVTRSEDITEVINYINSIDFVEAKEDNPNSWAYYIKIINKDSTCTEIKFVVNKISYNNSWYKGNSSIINYLDKLYKELEYPESQSTLKR